MNRGYFCSGLDVVIVGDPDVHAGLPHTAVHIHILHRYTDCIKYFGHLLAMKIETWYWYKRHPCCWRRVHGAWKLRSVPRTATRYLLQNCNSMASRHT